jgi:hypothetical protein
MKLFLLVWLLVAIVCAIDVVMETAVLSQRLGVAINAILLPIYLYFKEAK